VSQTVQIFRGEFSYKVDPKNRVSIHPDFRPAPGEKVFLMRAKSDGMPVLKVLNSAEYDRRVAIVGKSDKSEKDKNKLLGELARRCHEASINEQGKLLISKGLVEEVGIETEGTVWLIGRHSYFEIMSGPNYDILRKKEEEIEDDLGIYD
jgi:DNA-binding transcriptional regulator/RsmH inhibitor MraZ